MRAKTHRSKDWPSLPHHRTALETVPPLTAHPAAFAAALNGAVGGNPCRRDRGHSAKVSSSAAFKGVEHEAVHVAGCCIDELQYDIDPIGKTVSNKKSKDHPW